MLPGISVSHPCLLSLGHTPPPTPRHTPPALRATSPILGEVLGYSVCEAFAATSASKAFLTLLLCRGSTAKRGGGTNPKIREVARSAGGV